MGTREAERFWNWRAESWQDWGGSTEVAWPAQKDMGQEVGDPVFLQRKFLWRSKKSLSEEFIK